MCSDFTGTGSKPSSGRVLIFVQHANQQEYFYEQPVEFADGRWVSRNVRLGDPPDDGQFYLHARRLDDEGAAVFLNCRNEVCKRSKLPGAAVGTSGPITRTASLGSCTS
jgi:hypothetical protein